MSSKREEAAAKAARMTAVAEPAAAVVSSPAVVKSKPVRVSLDLVPALYEDLTAWNRDAARRLGRTKVTNADTLRHLVRVLLDTVDNPAVAEEVIRRLGNDQVSK